MNGDTNNDSGNVFADMDKNEVAAGSTQALPASGIYMIMQSRANDVKLPPPLHSICEYRAAKSEVEFQLQVFKTGHVNVDELEELSIRVAMYESDHKIKS